MAEIIKPIILDETGKEIVDAIKNISITVEGKNGLPQGGLANQILSKKSDTDYDAEWVDNIGQVESVNGKTGQVILTAEDVGATTEQWVNQQNYLKSIPSEYITETELDAKGYLTEHQDISNLATKAEVSEVENKIPTKVSQLENDKGYLTEHQDLTGYAKKTDIPDVSGFITEIPAEYVTDDELNAKGYLTEIPAEYVTETELNAKGYLTEHQSLANYSTTEEINNAISNHHDSTKQDTLTAGENITIENNVISATGGGSGSSYTFTSGLTETAGTVKSDLHNVLRTGQETNGKSLVFSGNGWSDNNPVYASGKGAFAGGCPQVNTSYQNIQATGQGSFAFGVSNSSNGIKSWGKGSVAMGCENYGITSSGTGSVVMGYGASGGSYLTAAYGAGSIAMGHSPLAQGEGSVAIGFKVISNAAQLFVNGSCNIKDPSGKENWYDSTTSKGTYICITGNGTSNTARANAYTLDWSGNGTFAGTVSSSTGADYAEYFEWKDGNTENEDRVGYIVTLDGDKIVKATSGDDILGICSGTAMVLGDSAEWNWSKRFLTDDFGRIIYEDIDVEHEAVLDEEGNVIEEAYVEHIHKPKENPRYDSSKPYERRSDRPEWQIVGMMGKLYVRDNGTCEVNGYATVDNGIAIKSTEKTNMRVMERVTENIVRVLLK